MIDVWQMATVVVQGARMKRRTENLPLISWGEVFETARAWEAEHFTLTGFVLRGDPTIREGAYLDVVVYDAESTDLSRPHHCVRVPWPAGRMTAQAAVAMHALFLAYQDMENLPWLWTRRRRKRAQG